MNINLNVCKDYRFSQGKFISVESGKEYKFRIQKDDKFYDYMRKYISNGKVDSMTNVGIDELFVKDSDTTFHKEQSVNLEAKIIVTEYNNVDYAYNIKIKNVSITSVKSYNSNGDGERVAKMCTLQIPYNTEIEVFEIIDYNKEEE